MVSQPQIEPNIDQLYVALLDLLDRLIRLRGVCGPTMRDGFLKMAQAKLVLGAQRIHNYDMRMAATTLVAVDDGVMKATTGDGPTTLKWHGILVPQPLIHGQKRFLSSIMMLVEIANVAREIDLILAKITAIDRVLETPTILPILKVEP